jgi:hypothetical protein
MVEIIKRGTLKYEKVYEATCRQCTTEFTFKRHEAAELYDPREGTALGINCPLAGCNNEVWVNA